MTSNIGAYTASVSSHRKDFESRCYRLSWMSDSYSASAIDAHRNFARKGQNACINALTAMNNGLSREITPTLSWPRPLSMAIGWTDSGELGIMKNGMLNRYYIYI
jgi:hypothetical protein